MKKNTMVKNEESVMPYHHKVQYYETDRMGITHHSNYVRWMEEARVDFLEQIGWSYKKLEDEGIISPVLGVECHYQKTTTFADEISIEVSVKEFKGVKLSLAYVMRKTSDGTEVCTGSSEHCFLDSDSRPVNLKRKYPEFYELLTGLSKNVL